MVKRTRIPILLLTGFLGSGKTSLLKHWLRAPEFADAMAIINEFGEVGLDDRLVQMSSDAPILLENGCACCEGAEDLNATLERLFWQRLRRQIPRFEWVLVETSGLADPAPIAAAISGDELLGERYRLAGVATTFDVRLGPDQIQAHPECRSQIMLANVLALTKTDIADARQIKAARQAVRRLRPDLNLVESAGAQLPAASILAHLPREGFAPFGETSAVAAHSPDVSSAFAPLEHPRPWREIEAALETILRRYGKRILRLKGMALVDDENGPVILQSVAGQAVERCAAPRASVADADRMGITVIAQFVPAELVARDFLSMLTPIRPVEHGMDFPARGRG